MTDKYAVIGNPIVHSKSPPIHATFAKQTNQDISYEAILAPLDGFEATVRDLIAQGYKGANVTVPFKFEAFELCSMHTERSTVAGAVNTLTFKSGEITGDNTDGVGLVNDIRNNLKHALEGSRILLLGAGGAAQGVLLPLIQSGVESMVIANRDVSKAYRMVERLGFDRICSDIVVAEFSALHQPFDVIINATSTGLSDAALPISDTIFAKNCLAYDMMYGRETKFMAQARKNGTPVADGLGMLVEQAAEAFYIWRGVRPQTKPVIEMLRKTN
jgi:shikimate dehydrogenase